MDKFESLLSIIEKKGRLAVAFSGGVDSTLVALAARRSLGEEVILFMITNPTIPESEVIAAKEVANELDMKLRILELDVLTNEEVTSNTEDRCGRCRKATMPEMIKIANELGFNTVADGANIDDLGDYRPGHAVSTELGIWHPLIEAELSKKEIREILKNEGITIHNRPSTPCLATRIPFDQKITEEKLTIIEKAEGVLRSRGFRNVRVRLYENIHGQFLGIVEVDHPESALKEWRSILKDLEGLDLYLDPRGYRQGSLNRTSGP